MSRNLPGSKPVSGRFLGTGAPHPRIGPIPTSPPSPKLPAFASLPSIKRCVKRAQTYRYFNRDRSALHGHVAAAGHEVPDAPEFFYFGGGAERDADLLLHPRDRRRDPHALFSAIGQKFPRAAHRF